MSFNRSNDGWGDPSRSKKRRFDRNRGRGYHGGRRNDYYSQNDQLTEQVQGWMQWVGSAGGPPGYMSDPSGGWGQQGYQQDGGYWSHPGSSQPYYPSYNEESEPAILTVAERLERLGEYLRRYHSNNDVQVIEKGVTASRSGLRADYSHEVVHKVGKKYIFTGCLKLNKVFIARSVGGDKQRTKQSTYRKAINIIRNKSIRHILGLRDVGIQILKIDAKSFFKKDEEYDDPGAIALKRFISIEKGEMQVDIPEGTSIDQVLKVELTDDEVKEKLAAVVSYCLETTRHPNASLMHLLDRNVFRMGLEPKCIVKFLEPDENRPAEENVICEYYLQKVLIGTGKGETRANAHAAAYENAYHKLTTMTGEEVFDAGKPTPEEEELKVAKTEVWAKSRTEGVESNIGRLKLLRRDPIQRNKEWNEMVIVETHDWSFNRRKNAYSILMMSAMWNGMLLEWRIEPDEKGYRCQMILQQTTVGERQLQGTSTAVR
ncbi:uncharacterized protein LOC124271174 [Haliotis rubra]|uniref:uncharacterized protein LOC124271174 n=1 Tax=Haliotis rubra TaxID=36100 RepID=UPI001EE513E2|nr:uncharacterized protein LOC124271174 [Haliotis rubra]